MYKNLKRGEDTEQMQVMGWAALSSYRFPELKLLFHIPNGGKRNKTEAARFKAMGVKSGVPDLCLPVPRAGYAGLYIEMKYGQNRPTEKQKEWIQALQEQNYKVDVCYGAAEAIDILKSYLSSAPTLFSEIRSIDI